MLKEKKECIMASGLLCIACDISFAFDQAMLVINFIL